MLYCYGLSFAFLFVGWLVIAVIVVVVVAVCRMSCCAMASTITIPPGTQTSLNMQISAQSCTRESGKEKI